MKVVIRSLILICVRAGDFCPPHSNYRSRTRYHHRSRALDRTGLDLNIRIFARYSPWRALAEGSKSGALASIQRGAALPRGVKQLPTPPRLPGEK
jgi:hypothetical protein